MTEHVEGVRDNVSFLKTQNHRVCPMQVTILVIGRLFKISNIKNIDIPLHNRVRCLLTRAVE